MVLLSIIMASRTEFLTVPEGAGGISLSPCLSLCSSPPPRRQSSLPSRSALSCLNLARQFSSVLVAALNLGIVILQHNSPCRRDRDRHAQTSVHSPDAYVVEKNPLIRLREYFIHKPLKSNGLSRWHMGGQGSGWRSLHVVKLFVNIGDDVRSLLRGVARVSGIGDRQQAHRAGDGGM
jgi:hypothetical protein